MEIREFIATLEKSNFSLSVEGGKLNLKGDRNKLTKEEIEAIKTNKDVIDYIKTNKNELIEYVSVFSDAGAVKKSKDVSSIYRLSGLQQGMLFHGLYDGETEAHKIQFVCDLIGVNTELFSQSWRNLLKKHTVLRSGVYYDAFSVPVQCVYHEVELPATVLDYRALTEEEQAAALQNYEAADRVKSFDFKAAPLMRIALLRLSEERYRMIWTSHHILFDGWSQSKLMEEFLNTYELLTAGKPVNQGEDDRYEDYIRYIERKDRGREEAYWRNYLRNVQQSTLLPFIQTTTERNKGIGNYSSQHLQLDTGTTARIQQYAQRNRLTVNTVMQAAWAYLLHRYTGNTDITYGVIVSGRPDDLPNVEQRVGMYINTLPLYTAIRDEQKIGEWLAQLQAEQVASRQYQYTPLYQTQQWTGVKGDLFDSLLVFENYPVSKMIGEKHWNLKVENVRMHDPANYPLTILINSAAQIHIDFHYNATLLEGVYIQEISGHFEQVLLQIAANPEGLIKDMELPGKSESKQLLVEFNVTSVAYPDDITITRLFEEQAAKTPAHTALVFEGEQLTYKELDERSNQLAHYLKTKGIQERSLVPICVERSLQMIVGVLAILKAGAVYVPIDPEYPAARIRYMLEDTGAAVIISSSSSKSKLEPTAQPAYIIEIDHHWPQIAVQPSTHLETATLPHHLAYILYTSGSTGTPKGVQMPGSNLVNLLRWQEKQFENRERRVLQFASLNFDVSFQEIFSTLCFGSSLYLIGEERRKDMAELVSDIERYGLTHLFIPYIVLKSLAEYVRSLNRSRLSVQEIMVAGEQLKLTEDIDDLLNGNNIKLINQYGPTEAHVVSSYIVTENHISNPLPPIGKPIDNVQLYILDSGKRICPVGVPGELYIGGAQVAAGYLNRDELTAEKFIPDPFHGEGRSMMYKTGDFARWLPDGNLEYLGRIDEQVKIRGYRVELGEIETILQQHDQVKGAVVLAKADNSGNQRLVGYIVPQETFDQETVISYLRDRLPEYMIPALWVSLESFPISPNGKIDRRALPDPGLSIASGQTYVAPRSEVETALALIFQELLGVEKVGVHDNFFELGGHSLLAMRAVSAIRRKVHKELAVKDLFEKPTIAALHHFIKSKSNGIVLPAIQAGQRPALIPLSFSQERLWFIDQLEGTVQYHIPAILHVKGKLNVSALQYALQHIVNRHEVIRTVIREKDDQPYQYIPEDAAPVLTVTDGARYQNDRAGLEQEIKKMVQAPFDLSSDLMVRAGLIRLSEEDGVLVVAMHHIASDGWSISIIVKELVELYEAYVQNRLPKLEPLALQYADYAIWQRAYLQGELLDKKLAFWNEKLSGVAPLELPLDFDRPAVQRTDGAVAEIIIDAALTERLQQLSRQQGASLFMTLLSAFNVLLHRYSGQSVICVGTPIANRTQQEVEPLIGFFVNTLALRSEVKSNDLFTDLLQQVKENTLQAYQYGDVPFEKVVDSVVKERDLSRTPLFQVLFVLHNTPQIPTLRLGDITLTGESFDHHSAKFDITLNIITSGSGLRASANYNTSLFSAATVQQMLLHFVQLLKAIVALPQQRIGAIPMLSIEEKDQLLQGFNGTTEPVEGNSNIISLFQKAVAATPGAVALVFGAEQLTYAELDKRSNQLAAYLQSRGIKAESIVPVCLHKSLELIVGILGILKAGGAYIPVDPAYPKERIRFMLQDTDAELLLTKETHIESLSTILDEEKMIVLDRDWNEIQSYPDTLSTQEISPEQLAYVLYTSGSTGQPKGVAVQHNSLANHLIWFGKQYGLTNNDSSLLISSFSFDGSMTATWPVLLSGGTLHLPEEDSFDPTAALQYIADHSITYLKTLPSVFGALIEQSDFKKEQLCKSLRLIIVGGERMCVPDFETYMNVYPEIVFANHYGPTECTISSSFYLIDKSNIDVINHQSIIGKPVANTQIYIVSEEGQLHPTGIPGEICIAGMGVARGYHNQPALTTEKFVANPFSNMPGARMYRTGDMGKRLADGNFEYLGRRDEQVKLRGYRIEPGEIENVLLQSGLVKKAVVTAKKDESKYENLIGYVVPSAIFDREGIIAHLKRQLPDYMIPALWIEMNELPLSPNGKIDRAALPDPEARAGMEAKAFIAPRSETEKMIAGIWMNLLQLTEVSVEDNFFQSGGHSFIAMRVLSALRKQLNAALTVKDIFLYPTIAALAANIDKERRRSTIPVIEVRQRPEHIPLSYNQQQLWFIDQLSGSVQYHIPSIIELEGIVDIDALINTFHQIVQRHEILRTVIQDFEGKPYQVVRDMDAARIPLTIINGSAYTNDEPALQSFIQSLIHQPFNLPSDFLMRTTLIQLDENKHVLVITVHHLITDAWSGSILVNEMVELYQSEVAKRPSLLQPLPLQYADYAIWQQEWMEGEVLERELDYWKEKLGSVEPLQLPTDYRRPPVQSTRGELTTFHIDNELVAGLQQLSHAEEATLFMTLLTVFNVFLYRYSGQEDICVGTGIAGREQPELEELIGYFLNILALRTQFSGNDSFAGLLQKVKATTLEAFEHQHVPFNKVVDAVVVDRDSSRSPLFQVVFTLNNTPDNPEIDLGKLKLTTQAPEHTTSKFDLTFFLTETPGGLNGAVEYCTDLFARNTIERMVGHFKELLSAIVQNQHRPICSLPMITGAEEQQLLVEFNNNYERTPVAGKNLVELFEKQVTKNPNQPAVIYKQDQFSFPELNASANQLARYLIDCGVRAQMLVPVCIEQSADLLVAILAILKTGSAYVPIDPEFPEKRIQYLLEDTAATIVVSNSKHSSKLPNGNQLQIIETDTAAAEIQKQSSGNVEINIEPHHVAYIIYTSGSTGTPKGVMVSHAAILNYLLNEKTKYITDTNNTGSFIHLSYTFDASLTALFMPLVYGKNVVIGSGKPVEVFEDENCRKYAPYDFIKVTPAHLELLQSSMADGNGNLLTKRLVVGGEALHYGQFEHFIEQGFDIEIVNEYGPTEASVGCSTYVFNTTLDQEQIKNGISIGKPIRNVEMYIVNTDNALQPVGVMGEICISGAGLANGYLNLPQLTAEKFVPNPFSKIAGTKMYRTGDIGRWLADGNMEYGGRKDDQVKIRGYRIELGEIEAALTAVKGISNATVVVSEKEQGKSKKLHAYLQADKERLPLLNNYLRLLKEKQISKEELNILPNGLPIFNSNLNEVRFLYKEIFEDHCYLKNGITLKPGSCVVDIGANAGFFTVFLNVLSKDIRVYSFEPIPYVFRYLDTNRQLYNVQGKAFQLALLDEEKEVEFTWYPGVSIVSGMKDDRDEVREVVKSYIRNSSTENFAAEEIESMLEVKLESQQITVKTKTLSQIIGEEKIEWIDLLKVDVENSEHLVLKGIKEEDWDKIGSAIIEVHDSNNRLQQIKDLLERKGFRTQVEKEEMLSEDDILYNLFAIKDGQAMGISAMGSADTERAAEYLSAGELENNVKAHIQESLPEYMMPAQFVLLDQFKLTSSGKIDKKVLPPVETPAPEAEQADAPESELQKGMLEIWKDLLELDTLRVHDNFFNAGGDSLLAVRVIAAMRKKLEIEIQIREIFDHPTIAGLAAFISGRQTTAPVQGVFTQGARPAYIPLSFSQDRLWFIDKLQGSTQYHIPAVLRLKGNLNKTALKYALQSIVNRHEVLRTVIRENNGLGYQFILPKDTWNWKETDGARFVANEALLPAYIEQLITAPFDLSKDQMLRAEIIRLQEDEHILAVTLHHIASDGWSVAIIIKEVMAFYNAFTENKPAQLPELRLQFADYAIWQKAYLQGELLQQKLAYWKSKLDGVANLLFPYDHTSTNAKGAIVKFGIDKAITEKLQQISREQGVTLFMTLLAAFKVLLYRYTGQGDICVGTSVAGRQLQEFEDLIGFFINAIALRSKVEGAESFAGLLKQVSITTLDAYEHQDVPFEKVVDAVLKERDTATTPLFQVVFAMQNTIETPALHFGGIRLSGESYAQETSKFNLVCNVAETGDGLSGSIQYATDKFSGQTIEQLIKNFKELLAAVSSGADQQIKDLIKVKKEEVAPVISRKAADTDYLWDKTMVDLFEEQAALSPDAIAIIYEEQQLTYRELNEWSNKVARYLIGAGVEEEDLVLICMDRTPELYVGILSILKAGGVFLPVDPVNPEERIHYMQKDSKAAFAITSRETSGILDGLRNIEIIELRKENAAINKQSAANLHTEIEPNHLAYVIYTSGSTGKPKGVSIMHRSNVNMSTDQVRQFGITASDKVLQFASISFDASVSEIFMAFYAGATLVVMKKETIQDTGNFTAALRNNGVSVVTLPPVYLKALPSDDLHFLRVIITAGEAPDVKQAAHLSRYVDYYNAYGPTECAVCASIYKVTPEDGTRVRMPIGKPIANTNMYVLDEDLNELPAGMQGDIYVSGVGLAKGYLRRPELTAEKFIPNPFGTGKKLYKTGDIGRWLNDGNLEFLGRKDDQIKLRGYRVELGEIENTLLENDEIENCAIVVNESKDDTQLIAYYQPKSKITLWPSVAEFYVYDDLLYKTMAGDEKRNAKYRNAFRKVVKDKVILEIGPGFEAILSRIAIEEGAKKVYAVELLEESYLKAKATVESLGLADQIIVIHDDIMTVALPEKADYCISEIVGAIGGSEGAAVLINSSRRLLKDPSHMVPNRSLTKIAAITLPDNQFDYSFEQLGAYYVEKIFEAAGRPFDLRLYLSGLPAKNIISTYDTFEDLDYTKECLLEEEHAIKLLFEQDAFMHGFIVWLNLYCDEEEVIDTVSGKYTWLPIYFPVFDAGEKVTPGDFIEAKITRKLSANGLNPDFVVQGTLVRNSLPPRTFVYESFNSTNSFKGNSFYKKVFEGEAVKISEKISKDHVKAYLNARLPDYMVPSLFMELTEFRVTISGKIDRKALPAPDIATEMADQYQAPRNEVEKALVEIWEELLEVENVGIQDDFFELGGHSLLAIRLISLIRQKLNIEIPIGEVFENPTIALLAGKLENPAAQTVAPAISVQVRPEHIPLSFTQERLFFIDQLEGSVQYHLPAVLRLKGDLNKAALQFALQTIVTRHEVLRTVIRVHEGHAYQFVSDEKGWDLEMLDGGLFETGKKSLEEYIAAFLKRPFNLSADHNLRASLVSLGSREHLLVVTVHHIASDGWSFTVMVRELAELYASYSKGRAAQLPALPIQYADYAIWQRSYLSGEVLNKKLDYWEKKLEGVTALQLPADYTRPPVQSSNGAVKSFRLTTELTEAVNGLARRQDATLFMTLLAAFKVLLHQYSGQEDVCIGTPVANRTNREVEALIGFFVNTLAIRSQINGDDTFDGLLQQVKATTLEAYEYGDVPFEKVVDAVMKDRDRSRHPLFQVMFMLQNTPDIPEATLGNVALTSEPFAKNTSKFDLSFALVETNTGIFGAVEYCTDIFSEATVVRMMGHFETLLKAIVANPAERLDQLTMLTEAEKQQLVAFNDTDKAYPTDKTIIDLFEEQAAKTPGATALLFEDQQLTYQELNEQANQVAHYLLQKGVTAEMPVPVCLERSLNMLISIIGILKAGAAYVPVDPQYPQERINYMLEDTAASITISSSGSSNKIETSIEIIEIDTEWETISKGPTGNSCIPVAPNSLAYIIYTSGSTGKPKGVMIEHSNLASFINWCRDEFSNSPFEIAYATTSMCFDLSVFEFFYPLVTGKKIRILENGTAIGKYLPLDQQVLTNTVPVVMEHLLKEGADLRNITVVNMAGEPIPKPVQQGLDTERMEVRNLYGPTEDTTYSTVFLLKKDEPVLIGKPISNTRIYITNKAGLLVPIGVPGELCIGGAGVARGYLNRPGLTAEKFINDRFSGNGGRLYKTGDLARRLADGNIEYLGRIDNQVKVRGYRIELGEIETAILQSSQVSEAVITAIPDSGGSKKLVGYVVPKDAFSKQALTAYLQNKLPGYMVPAVWVQLEKLPLTPNGKIDRKALPHPESGDLATHEYVAPRNETEQRLAAIWQELLLVERVGIHDNFFELGGHSLLAMRLIAVIRTTLGVEVRIKDLFTYPAIAEMAAYLSIQEAGNLLPSVTVQLRPAFIPLSFSQERLFFIHQLEGSIQYHIPLVLRLKGHSDVSLLRHTLQSIVNRHEVLRTVFRQQEGDGYQYILEKDRLEIVMVDDPALTTDAVQLKAFIHQQIYQPFDLSGDCMLRAAIIRIGEAEHILVATLHHIAADGWSLSLIVKELIEIYSAGVEGRPAQIILPSLQYADYAIWQRTYITGEVLDKKLAYWKTKLEGTQPLQLPTDYARPVVQNTKGAVIAFHINKQLAEGLHMLGRQQDATLFMTLLAGINVLLHRYSGQEDICIGTPIANRPGSELEEMIGLFVNTLALRTEVNDDVSFTHLLQQVKATALEAYEHQEIPFEKIVDLVVKERDRSRHPLFQVMFILQNTPEVPEIKLGDLTLSGESVDQYTSRFDLTFAMSETKNGMQGSLEYNTDLYSEATIMGMIGHFENLLTAIVQDPSRQVAHLPMLPETEVNKLLAEFNDTSVAYPKDKTITGLFEEQVIKTPDGTAVVFEGEILTYQQLGERSNQLAHYLRSKGVKEETLVPICVERSLLMIIGVLGILKAGGVYVPVDPEYPAGRISYMLQDTGAALVVSSSKSSGKLPLEAGIELIELDTLQVEIAAGSGERLTLQTTPHHLAYILYTSGSTGTPKGVKMPGANLVNLLQWQEEQFSNHRRRVLQFASLNFDVSFQEIFSTLCFGSTLYLIGEERRKDMAELVSDIERYGLTHLFIPYIVLKSLAEHRQSLPDSKWSLEEIIVAGEQLKLTEDVIELLEKNEIKLINQYGPTEAHVVSSYAVSRNDYQHSLPPIGKPVSNVQLYVLNRARGLSGVGIPGELYIAGAQVAAGYLNREDLTEERFIKNVFDPAGESMMYKTGDLARWLPDGNLEYRGRMDEQVKIRGYRVELGEIEMVLQQHEQVRGAVVLAKVDNSGNQRLVAYVVPEEEFDQDTVVIWLKKGLPQYMVPALWVMLESFPVSPNGKVDKKALPDPDVNAASGHEYVAPRNELERELALIWQELLGVEKVGVNDNFFELGGHSLLAMKLVAHLKKRLLISIPIQVLFQFTTISGLSNYLEWESEASNATDGDAVYEVINI